MPRTRSLAWSELKIGLIAVIALVLAAVTIFLVGGQGGYFWQQYHLVTHFENVQGLKEGAVVRVAGVEVGTVSEVTFEGPVVKVIMEISESMQDKITTESQATIGSVSLLGESAVDISPGRTGEPLPDWGFVKSGRTPGQLADVAESATRGLQEATRLVQDIRQGRGTVGKLFTDEQLYREISQLMNAAQAVATDLRNGRGTIGQLLEDEGVYRSLNASLRNLERITARINAGEGSLGRLLQDEQFAKSLSSTTANLDQVTGRMSRGEGTVGKLLQDDALYKQMAALTERLHAVAVRLDSPDGTAGRLLRDKQLYENMNAAVAELRNLLADVRKDPRKYLNVRVSLF